MSDKLKRVLDTNLAGLHVTDAQVNAVLRRVSQDEKRPRVIRWQAIAAVLLRPAATAVRTVSGLSPTSTIFALP